MKKNLLYFMPFAVAAVFTILSFTQIMVDNEHRAYDLFLRIKPEVPEEKKIVLIDVDDLAISKVGVWPWSRSIMADGLLLLKEFKAEYAVFDIEYTEKSPRGINAEFLEDKIPDTLNQQFDTINSNISDLFGAISSGQLRVRDAADFASQLKEINNGIKLNLLDTMGSVARDNDEYLGKAARYFGNAFFTVNMFKGTDDSVPADLKEWASENIPISAINIVSGEDDFYRADDLRPAIAPVLKNGRGAGFPNVFIDNDGVRRRIDLLRVYKGRYFPQLAFSPLYDWLGKPEIQAGKGSLLLKGAVLPDGKTEDISIPLVDGQLLINWPVKSYEKSFRHMTYWYLEMHNRLYKSLAENLKLMKHAGYLEYYNGDTPLYDLYQYADDLLSRMVESGDTSNFDEYAQVREYFLLETASFLSGDAEKRILNDIEAVINSDSIPADVKNEYTELKKDVPDIFAKTISISTELAEARRIIRENVEGSFCIIGHTGTSTTDIGVNPFEKEYMNVGTHASVANTILSRQFISIAPFWIPILASFLFSLLVFAVIKRRSAGTSIIIGLSFIALILASAAAVFRYTGMYVNVITPAASVFVTFIIYTMVNLITTSKEKIFIRNAFGHYLSQDVISQLMNDPEKLKLGGDKKELTAIFTDVRGFSTISESLDPSDLVKLLNEYLTAMSDIILDSRGTIDKYEGDAIISFFGAPVEFPDHAQQACSAAVKMKKMEMEINKVFLDKQIAPSPLMTRIGINTGEMVVGNMGTARKMDYTIMGNAVNLAARLEGVNKQYGTWILASEYTISQTKNRFACRKLDPVRVVGINRPVQLFELIDEKKEASDKTLEIIELSHSALEKFQGQDWDGCADLFNKVLGISPDDGPASTYIKRCADFKKTPPPKNWDGVFNLSVK